MDHTQNYQLSRWEKDDRIMMEDFNADNARIDAAIAAKADAEDVTALGETVAAVAAALGAAGKNTRITWGSYNGTGTYGIGNKTTVTPGLYPVLVCVGSPSDTSYTSWPWFMMRPCTEAQTYGGHKITVDWTDTSVSWYGTYDAEQQMNRSGSVYYYIALGYDRDAEAAG